MQTNVTKPLDKRPGKHQSIHSDLEIQNTWGHFLVLIFAGNKVKTQAQN